MFRAYLQLERSMDTIGAANEWRDGRVLEHQQSGPTLSRMVLGLRLRRLREAGRVTGAQAAEAIRVTEAQFERVEHGRAGIGVAEVIGLLSRYGVTDDVERETVVTLAEQAALPAWWHSYRDVVPGWLEAYLGLEQAATMIRSYEVQFVHGLLQTEAYARAVIALGHPDATKGEIERRVELRMLRQQVLSGEQAPHLWAVVDEAVLRRPIGGPATMRAQFEHLVDVSELPHITLQVIPFHASGRVAASGPITLLRLPERELPDVVYLEQLTSALYPYHPADIEQYWHVMNRLVTEAEPPIATRAILDRMMTEV
jgi:transcriptional regulator with XRE-family HTH domain